MYFFLNTILADHLNLVIYSIEKLPGFKTTSLKITNSKYHKAYHQVKNYLGIQKIIELPLVQEQQLKIFLEKTK